jgi:hypothetical protein
MGQFTGSEIPGRINVSGATPRHGRRRFSKDCITDILTDPFYIGKLPYRLRQRAAPKLSDGLHAPNVSDDLLKQCWRMRDMRRADSRAVQKPRRIYFPALRICLAQPPQSSGIIVPRLEVFLSIENWFSRKLILVANWCGLPEIDSDSPAGFVGV